MNKHCHHNHFFTVGRRFILHRTVAFEFFIVIVDDYL
jgi:hypothetical protein